MVRVFPKGLLTALVTPFLAGELDEKSIRSLLSRQTLHGVDGLVIAGTTGEVSTLTEAEYGRLLAIGAECGHRRIPLLAGVGTNCTATTIRRAQLAEKVAYDGLLAVTPYYNKPTQAGLFAHYAAVAAATDLPIVLYSIKSRCGIEIELDTICRLHENFPSIAGLKESSTDCGRVAELRRRLGADFCIYSGDDEMTLPMIAVGADGVISSSANLFPEKLGSLVHAALANDVALAREFHSELLPLWRALSCEVNPVPIKFALQELGDIASGEVRLPLVSPSEEHRQLLRAALALPARKNHGA
jgi:4-hydroxy-tetrahydrodipicolinate synthase